MAPAGDELQPVSQNLHQGVPQQLHPSVRIIIEYSHAISIDVTPAGSTDSDADAASRQPYVELNAAQSSLNAFRKLAVVQSQKDLGVTIKATTTAKKGPILHCRLSFDPVADRIAISNRDGKSVLAIPLDRGGPAQSKQSVELKTYFVEILESESGKKIRSGKVNFSSSSDNACGCSKQREAVSDGGEGGGSRSAKASGSPPHVPSGGI
jgi:hypothetical protein